MTAGLATLTELEQSSDFYQKLSSKTEQLIYGLKKLQMERTFLSIPVQ